MTVFLIVLRHAVAGLAGGVMNMIRGGLWRDQLPGPGRIYNAVLFGFFCFGLAWLAGVPDAFYRSAASAGLMFVLQLPGYGVYVGTILNGYYMDRGEVVPTPAEEIRWIDAIIWGLHKRPVWYGFAGATLRGGAWGAGLAIPWMDMFMVRPWTPAFDITTYSFWPALGGLSFGLAFWIARQWPNSSVRWKIGEAIFGAFLWSAVSATIISGVQ